MIEASRIKIYDYVYDLLYGVVTENVYRMNEPQELTESDVKDGFVVMYDDSEFDLEATGWVRVFVQAYIPPISRGRLDKDKYAYFEDMILQVARDEAKYGTNEHYSIQEDGILSMDDNRDTNANNSYNTFIKSFIVNLD